MEIILLEASYNAACMFLETENRDNRFGKLLDTEMISSLIEIRFEKATFFYEEKRGYLMRKR
jgi:hypothetical protein